MVSIARDDEDTAIRRPTRGDTERRRNGHVPFNVGSPDDTAHINALFYGDTGVGKTHLLGSIVDCPDMLPCLLLDIDGGSLTLRGKAKGIEIFRPRRWKDIQEVYRYFYFDNRGRYRSIGMDTLTEQQRRGSMASILGEVDQQKGGYFKDLEATPVANRQDWLKSSGQMTKVIQAYRSLAYLEDPERRVHVFFTAHEKMDEKRRLITPELPGQLGPQCGRWVDILGRLSVHTVEEEDDDGRVTTRDVRHLLVSHYENADGVRYLAKNRGGRLGRSVWDPTMEKLSAAWVDNDDDTRNDD